ncbi:MULTISPECIES: hypothetical protein [Bacillus]|uniref:hypothetical protein n=1 Tax=Bacillus TaxID=1386 RepID=UPI00077901F9|nr:MULTISPECIES: hypothetical protein [Bacillus subtilis group]MBW8281585.1 hypothetical protein [Bacillus amyloliquefaciens]MCG3228424.1 hypothetical protein [Bacillus subtilis]MEC1248560.1 hypothetical protein [Bacillus amyloliquefaciens]MEC1266904.1 hypothetical protein [Bacillus subtilis]MEC2251721.1 hypothetical protein [Bacillus amyloliquefaciens]
MFKKIILATSALTFSLSLVLPLDGHAKAQEVTLQAQQEVTYQTPAKLSELPTNTTEQSGEFHTNGIKKWIAKEAMKATASALRHGGRIVGEVVDELGGSAGKTFAKHTDDVADALDELVKRGDVVEDAIIDTVSSYLIDAGVKSSTARTIASVFTFLAF